jgi:hypothetical protein
MDCSSQCRSDLFLDDFIHAQRFSFLNYNSLFNPGFTGDDGTMKSMTLGHGDRRLTLVPKSNSYFYSQVSCHEDLSRFEGFGFTVKMPAGATFAMEFQSAANSTLNCQQTNLVSSYISLSELGFVSTGSEMTIRIPFKILNVNPSAMYHVLFSGFTVLDVPVCIVDVV